MSFYYPPLSAEQFFFAYPDDESLRMFFDQTLGSLIDTRKEDNGISGLSDGLLVELTGISFGLASEIQKIVCVSGMADNVAVLACWLMMKERFDFTLDLDEIAHPWPDRVYKNRPLALALTNDLKVNKEGEIEGMMDPESIGLIDCARRAVNQVRFYGRIVDPIHSVDDNLMVLAQRQRETIMTAQGRIQ